VLIRCAEGSLLIAPSWSRVAWVIAATGLTERDDAIFVLDLLRPGDLFVDVGANIGFYTVLAARRGAQVEAYEPTPDAAAACERSLALNSVGQLAKVNRAACGAVAGTVTFTTGLDISNHIAGKGEAGIEVPLRTLDADLAGREAQLSMFKVDAEGHDIEVLRGAREAIARLRPVILVEVWTGGSSSLEVVSDLGYRPYEYDRGSRTLSEAAAGRGARNLLMIADDRLEEVRNRVREAERPSLRAPSVSWLGG
jgi:FkbM family methyltransferase